MSESPTLHRNRSRAVKLTALVLFSVLALGLLVPMPLRTQTEGVVWLPDQALIRAGVNGNIKHWLVQPGTLVHQGTALLVMDDPELETELAVARAKFAEAQARYNAQWFNDPVQGGVLREQLEHEQRNLERVNERYQKLVVYSEADGVLTVPKSQDMTGQYFKKGELLGYLMDREQMIARVAVSQENIDLVRTRLKSVELRFAEDIPNEHTVQVLRETPSALNELPSAALSQGGGGQIPVDPSDSKGVKTLEGYFFVDLSLPRDEIPNSFGGRVYVRFDHMGEPLLNQLYRRVRQLFLSRFHV